LSDTLFDLISIFEWKPLVDEFLDDDAAFRASESVDGPLQGSPVYLVGEVLLPLKLLV